MAFVTGVDYKFEVDPAGTTTYVELPITGLTDNTNTQTDTFYRFTDDGFATNVVTGLDPEFTVTIKADSTNTTLNALLDKRYTLSRTVGLKITDDITGEVLTAVAVLTAISTPRTVQAVTEVSMTFKLSSKPTIA